MLELWSYPPDASHVQGLTNQLMVINTKAHMCQLVRIEVDNKSDKTTKRHTTTRFKFNRLSLNFQKWPNKPN